MIQKPFQLLLLLLALGLLANGYDTGHHNDLSRNVLQVFNYSTSAQKVVPLANWFTDYFSYTFDSQEKLPVLNLMHFDNLFTFENTSYYFSQLVLNTRNAIRDVATENDPLKYLMLLGCSLHAVQDYYTHSSWTSIYPQDSCACYRSETFWSVLAKTQGDLAQAVPSHLALHTYSYGNCDPGTQYNCRKGTVPHGDYCEGINKDSYVRPYWEQSYAFAFAACIEWLYNVEKWAREVNPSVVEAAKVWAPSPGEDTSDLDEDVKSSYVISYSVETPINEDGHWKGPGSGDLERLATSYAEFVPSKSIYKSLFVDQKLHEKITSPDLYIAPDARGKNVSPAMVFVTPFSNLTSAGLTDYIAVKLRTTHVKVDENLVTSPSPYAVVNIEGMDFVENIQHDKKEFNPHWTSIKFIPIANLTTVSMTYTLYDDEFPSDDDVVKIADKDTLQFTLDLSTGLLSGDVTGNFNSTSKVFTTSHEDNSVSFYVSTRTLSLDCESTSVFSVPFCEDEAYTQLGIHEVCFGLGNNEQGTKNNDK
jgi:hypothetical protein